MAWCQQGPGQDRPHNPGGGQDPHAKQDMCDVKHPPPTWAPGCIHRQGKNNMATTNTNPVVRAKLGDTIRVHRTHGVNRLNIGLSTSGKPGAQGIKDVTPEEPLLVVEVKGGGFYLVQRTDGTQVHVHENHVNVGTGYNLARKRPVSGIQAAPTAGNPVAKVTQAMADLKAAQARLVEAKAELAAMIAMASEAQAMLDGIAPTPAATIEQMKQDSIPQAVATGAAEPAEDISEQDQDAAEYAALEAELAAVG